MNKSQDNNKLPLENIVRDVLKTIKKDREIEIISKRFGLYERRETLEQIGETLGITRERVRQLEKAVLSNLVAAAEKGSIAGLDKFEEVSLGIISSKGNISRVSALTNALVSSLDKVEQSRVAFLSLLSSKLELLEDDDDYYASVAIKKELTISKIKTEVSKIVDTIKNFKEPKSAKDISEKANIKPLELTEALASVSKKLAFLNGVWGLVKWPTVNPKNIRDKIYVVLKENGAHMHFNEISAAIKDSEFRRKNVTTQAIHNELIKDNRFVLIGRGIYALKEWGYKQGTVADIIKEVLREASEPLHRDEIVKRVLKSRFVKETTILLNLQGKNQFKRVAKATYALNDPEA